MTAHNHREIVPGCYRCELGQDEARAAAREQLIEDAAKAIWVARNGADSGWAEMAWAELTMPDDWNQEALDALEEARAALAVFEEAHTPTDDEREALARELFVADETDKLSVEECVPLAERVYDLGFHRTVQSEPSREDLTQAISDAFYGNHYDPSGHAADAVLALIHHTVQGEPSDAQVLAALEAYAEYREADGPGDAMRAALRAAAETGGER